MRGRAVLSVGMLAGLILAGCSGSAASPSPSVPATFPPASATPLATLPESSTTPTPIATLSPTPSASTIGSATPSTSGALACSTTYVVQKYDSGLKIAMTHGTTPDRFAVANGYKSWDEMRNGPPLRVGQVVCLP